MNFFPSVPTFEQCGKKNLFPSIMNSRQIVSEFTCHVEQVTGRTLHFTVSKDLSFNIT